MEEKVKRLIVEPLKKHNIILDDVNYVVENNVYYLRITIDKKPFVDIDTCVLATDIINPILDKLEDEFKDAYILDVCSKERKED